MKFLEDAKLAQLTADLTDAPLVGCHGGGSHHGGHHREGGGVPRAGTGSQQPTSRILNGRIEAYTTKRVSSDKKYAHALGEKYIREIDQVEEEMAQFHRSLGLPSLEPKPALPPLVFNENAATNTREIISATKDP